MRSVSRPASAGRKLSVKTLARKNEAKEVIKTGDGQATGFRWDPSMQRWVLLGIMSSSSNHWFSGEERLSGLSGDLHGSTANAAATFAASLCTASSSHGIPTTRNLGTIGPQPPCTAPGGSVTPRLARPRAPPSPPTAVTPTRWGRRAHSTMLLSYASVHAVVSRFCCYPCVKGGQRMQCLLVRRGLSPFVPQRHS